MADEQDRAEAIDEDEVVGEYPPERPLGAQRRQDDAIPETFAGRDARTEPEVDEERPVDRDQERPIDGIGPVSPTDEVAETLEAAEEAALHVRRVG